MTRYLVLKKSEAGWVIYGDDVQASGERAAIKHAAEGGGAGEVRGCAAPLVEAADGERVA